MQHYQNRKSHIFGKFFLAFFLFTAAYLTTVTVQAQDVQATGDVIQLNDNKVMIITGQVVEAKENYIIITSTGKQMKIVLDDMDIKADAGTLFQKGMTVTVNGEMNGDDFGMPLVEAKSVTASQAPATTFYNPNNIVR